MRSAKSSSSQNQASLQAKNDSLGKVIWSALLAINDIKILLEREIENEDSGVVCACGWCFLADYRPQYGHEC